MIVDNFAYRFRLYPNKAQREQIRLTIGAARWVYNEALATKRFYWDEWHENIHANFIINMIPYWKALEPWLKGADSVALQQTIRDLEQNYQRFFTVSGCGIPRFKSKHHSRWSYRTVNMNRSIRIVDKKHIRMPKLGLIRCCVSRKVEGTIKHATIVEERDGSFHISITCANVHVPDKPATDKQVGIDLGLEKLVATSNGDVIEYPKFYKRMERKLAREQRKLSKKRGPNRAKGIEASNNWRKQRREVAKIYLKVKRQRSDYNHKLTTALVNENQVICAETLAVKNMTRNRHLAKALQDAAFADILRMLSYKCDWHGRKFVQIDQWYPSSKTCSDCGHVQDISLDVRTYKCPQCGCELDRDFNAALNILAEGLRKLGRDTSEVKACGDDVRSPMKQESPCFS